LNVKNQERIQQLLNSEAVNYLETSERLIIKNILEKETISDLENNDLDRIFVKYRRFLKN